MKQKIIWSEVKAEDIQVALKLLVDPKKREVLPRFFKTGKGEYGEGDIFWSISVPNQRAVVKEVGLLSLEEIEKLLYSKVHECRFTGLLFLVQLYKKSKKEAVLNEKVVAFYLKHFKQVNNWDLVDTSAYSILGDYLLNRDRSILYEWIESTHLWQQRIAMVATMAFVRKGEREDTFALADRVLLHTHDLMQKATGWLLRETTRKGGEGPLRSFLEGVRVGDTQKRYQLMPRTMLRYCIEKFDETLRQDYLKGRI